jgi:hypothetical protein
MLWSLAVATATVPTSPGPAPTLAPEEAATLAAREIVVRTDLEGAGGGVLGIVDVAADRAATWKAVLDFEGRVGQVDGIVSVERYDETPTGVGATWTLKKWGFGASFSMKYHLDPGRWFVHYVVDPARPGDLASGAGSYELHELPTGTRLVYRSEMDSGAPVPGFVKRWLAVDALQDQLDSIRGRAEAASR